MLLQDIRSAFRQLFVAPGFCLAVILTLALGVGVNAAVFSMLDGFLLRKLPYPEPDRIAALVDHTEGRNPKTGHVFLNENDSFDGASWQILRQNVDAAAFASYGGTDGVNLKAATDVRNVRDTRVSAGYFEVLGIPLQLGRAFNAGEDRPHGPPAVILTDALWRSAFAADRNIPGQSILLKGEPHTVVGVLPPNALTPTGADLFTPLQPSTSGECGGDNCGILIRLKPGATWEQLRTQLGHIRLPSDAEAGQRFHGHAWIYARPLQLEFAGEQRGRVIVLMLAVSFILLIACANLAGLALVRFSRRTREIATRLALGATRWAVLRQLWMESLVLAAFGAALGILLASLIIRGLKTFLVPEMVPVGGFHTDSRVLAFTLAVSLLTTLLFGALPALQTGRFNLRSSLSSIPGGSGRLRQCLIAAEVALTVILLASAGLMIRTLLHLETQPPGFDPHDVMTARASLDDARYHDMTGFQTLLQKSVAEMRQSLGVNDVAVGLSLPWERGLNDGFKILDGKQTGQQNASSLAWITPAYFSTLRIPLVGGRPFEESDTPTSEPVAIVNQSFAKRFLLDPLPLGRHLRSDNVTCRIVGVVGDVAKRPGIDRAAPISTEPVFYLPATQVTQGLVNVVHIWFQPSWIVRVPHANRAAVTRTMQQALARVDPDLPFSGFYSMDQILREQLQQQRLEVLLLASLAALALLLSAVGVYALVSNLVVQRTREIGIRIALGSTSRRAMVEIGSSGVIAAFFGLASGLALSSVALRVLSSEIYGVKVYDPVTLTLVPVLLAVIAALASILPTLRIARLDPVSTLRAE